MSLLRLPQLDIDGLQLDDALVGEATGDEVEPDEVASTDQRADIVGSANDLREFVKSSGVLLDDVANFVDEEVVSRWDAVGGALLG